MRLLAYLREGVGECRASAGGEIPFLEAMGVALPSRRVACEPRRLSKGDACHPRVLSLSLLKAVGVPGMSSEPNARRWSTGV